MTYENLKKLIVLRKQPKEEILAKMEIFLKAERISPKEYEELKLILEQF